MGGRGEIRTLPSHVPQAHQPPAHATRLTRSCSGMPDPTLVGWIPRPQDDDFFMSKCKLEGGREWRTLVELNKVVIRNDRWPLLPDYTMCKFIQNYRLPGENTRTHAILGMSLIFGKQV